MIVIEVFLRSDITLIVFEGVLIEMHDKNTESMGVWAADGCYVAAIDKVCEAMGWG
jgi:hypothetical protein